MSLILAKLHEKGLTRFVCILIYVVYKIKGRDIRSVKFIKDLNVWEFKIGQDFFYSAGAGWAYDYPFLLNQFKNNLGFNYVPKENDVVFDVGAGLGEELMVFSKCVGQNGKVFAIEAHPRTFRALNHNCCTNKFYNVILLNIAVADVSGFLFIQDGTESIANKVSSEQGQNSFRVEAITIEQLVDRYGIGRIDFVKVNIEGAEQLLIKGIGTAIDKINHMAISCHDFRFEKEGDQFFKTKAIVQAFLRENDFDYVMRKTNDPLLNDYIYAFRNKQL